MPRTDSRSIHISLPSGDYDVLVGAGLVDRSECFATDLIGADVLIVTNETVAPLYHDRLLMALGRRRVEACVLPDGEEFKTLETFSRVIDVLVRARFHRDVTVVALGGGVIGDIAGFAAACYQRGVDVVQVPTTLLAQVDASVGGKTGVNHPGGKNLIGAFHQPRLVVADVATLETLPSREYLAGMAEVVKYGAGLDEEFFLWLEQNVDRLLRREPGPLVEAVARCCECKARIVEQDEKEAGRRALLNLGHTFGHAFEAAMGYREWLHGEAVSAGMAVAARLSAKLGHLPGTDAGRIIDLLDQLGLPTRPPDRPASEIIELMAMDKKVLSGRMRFVLLRAVGDSFVTDDVVREDVESALQETGAE
jgi:3-dehydroquinate synthase